MRHRYRNYDRGPRVSDYQTIRKSNILIKAVQDYLIHYSYQHGLQRRPAYSIPFSLIHKIHMETSLFEKLCDPAHLRNAWNIVYHKKSSGGIDGINCDDYASKADNNLSKLCISLKNKSWKPQPYMSIKIPKKDSSTRELGMMTIEDKIVQQAIKMLIEPILEKQFYPSSYAYRPGRGHIKAVRRTFHECHQVKNKWYLKLDIDNFFDNIEHQILFTRLNSVIHDNELCRLIELCVLMGSVDKAQQWSEKAIGLPQGAILSPMLANCNRNQLIQ